MITGMELIERILENVIEVNLYFKESVICGFTLSSDDTMSYVSNKTEIELCSDLNNCTLVINKDDEWIEHENIYEHYYNDDVHVELIIHD